GSRPPAGRPASRPPQTGLAAAETPVSMTGSADAGAGIATTDHFLPSQCSTSPWSGVSLPSCIPAAQTLLALTASTPYRWFPVEPGFGVWTTVQLEPSQCSASVSNFPFWPSWSPPPRTSDGDGAC